MSDSPLFECHTLEEHAQAIADFLPNGRLYQAKNEDQSIYRFLLRGLAGTNQTVESFLKLFDEELDIANTTAFLEGWEATVGIPDDCFNTNGTLEERRRQVLIKLSALGVQTEEDFIELAATFGVTIEISQGVDHFVFPIEFPIIFFDGVKQARFTMIVEYFVEAQSRFPLTFPFVFGDEAIPVLECLFRRLVPANVDVIFFQSGSEPPDTLLGGFSGGFSPGFDT